MVNLQKAHSYFNQHHYKMFFEIYWQENNIFFKYMYSRNLSLYKVASVHFIYSKSVMFPLLINEPRYEKTGFLHMRKQRRNREADQRLCFRYIDRTIPLLSKSETSSL